jgi:hypothetical protein
LRIGHINLAPSFNGTGEHFVTLVEAIQAAGMQQHVLTRNVTLARRLDAIEGVEVGPAVRSAVTAYCLMPIVDLAHIHDAAAGQAGLLLTLTRSVPYVLSYDSESSISRNPLAQAVYRRALCVICRDDSEASIVRHFDPSLRTEIVPPLLRGDSADGFLRVYQNSQRMPIAGNSGIQ